VTLGSVGQTMSGERQEQVIVSPRAQIQCQPALPDVKPHVFFVLGYAKGQGELLEP
jgi:hypothetical protein